MGTVSPALLSAFMAICPCADMAWALAQDHGCCRPETALASADSDCCPTPSTAPRLGTTPRPEPSMAPAMDLVDFEPAHVPDAGIRALSQSSSPPFFRPPSILRI